jgi:hypothetical protein
VRGASLGLADCGLGARIGNADSDCDSDERLAPPSPYNRKSPSPIEIRIPNPSSQSKIVVWFRISSAGCTASDSSSRPQ